MKHSIGQTANGRLGYCKVEQGCYKCCRASKSRVYLSMCQVPYNYVLIVTL